MRRARTPARVVEVPAGSAAASALPEFDNGETVVAVGLCGALRRLKAGEIAVYGRVVDATNTFAPDPPLVDVLAGALSGAVVVTACTADRVVTTMAARAVLAQRFDADVVDMEGSHLAAALVARGVRFAMVRVVSDDASRDLPPIGDAIDPTGRIQPWALALAFARAPQSAFAFIRNARRALATLTETARAIALISSH